MGQWQHLYNSKAWQVIRADQLRRFPLCAMHLKQGRSVLATVADHVVPHRGDERLFYEGDLQSLCKSCHDSVKQRDENRGYSTACGVDGWPVDPAHPMNRADR